MEVPVVDREDGWDDVSVIPVGRSQGIELKKIMHRGEPGAQFRIRTVTHGGSSYDATVISFRSNGIHRSESLEGYDFGGHEVKAVKVQKIGVGTAELVYTIHGED